MGFPSTFRCWVLTATIVFLEHGGCKNRAVGCLEEEKIALLKLKDAINNPNASAVHPPNGPSLPSWGGEEKDCCLWRRITCDNVSKRVSQLDLSYSTLSTNNLPKLDGFLDASLFSPFQELQYLNLEFHLLQGFIGVLGLRKLQVLELGGNQLAEIPPLGELQSLKFLNLEYNRIENLTNFQDLATLSALELLDLTYNKLATIHPSIWALTSLEFLSIRSNMLSGSLPGEEGLCKLIHLQELDLSENNIDGIIPPCLCNMTSIRLLELSRNGLQGCIPPNLFSSLKSLEYVSLSYNHFDGSISFSSFGGNPRLEVFKLNSYNSQLKIEIEHAQWTPAFQLKILQLSNCTINESSREVPSFLLSQYDLRFLDLSHDGMTGEIPFWLIYNNSRLEFLSLRNNSFTGQFVLRPDFYSFDMFSLDVSMNHIKSEIATTIGSIFPNLTNLNMSMNEFQGRFPSSISRMRELERLDLSNNRLSGEVPEELFTGCLRLRLLKLSNNNLGGLLLPKRSNLRSLWSLLLDNNNFYGELSPSLLNSSSLDTLDISNNSIWGTFPDWIGELAYLRVLVLSRNHFEGKLPASFCELRVLDFLDLSWNNFHDTLPPCANLSSLRFLHLQGNGFHGSLPGSISRSSSLVTLDARDNYFLGLIPDWIGSLSNLRILLLKGNNLNGSLPVQLCQLKSIRILDLSSNNLSGLLPSCLFNIPFGRGRASDFIFEITEMVWMDYKTLATYSYNSRLDVQQYFVIYYPGRSVEEEVQFMTKSRSESYEGNILYFMSGIDFSFNRLSGPIPPEIGYLDNIHTLNLSNNHFNGSIPATLSKLKEIQSLDLSRNMLIGSIPPELTDLTFLSVFSVAYNNLSGQTPERKLQFATFPESSYQGNPLLCGLPLDRSCNTGSVHPRTLSPAEEQDHSSFKSPFLWSFLGSFAVSSIATVVFFYFKWKIVDEFLGHIGAKRYVEISSKLHR